MLFIWYAFPENYILLQNWLFGMVAILVYTGGTKVGKLKESMLISGRYLKIDS